MEYKRPSKETLADLRRLKKHNEDLRAKLKKEALMELKEKYAIEDSVELRGCPLCGMRAEINGGVAYQIRCSHCGMGSGFFAKVEEAVRIWNRRQTQ